MSTAVLESKTGTSRKVRPNKTKKLARPRTEVVLILDESGSMGSCRDATIRGFNEQVQRIQEFTKDQDIKVSLIVFNAPENIREVIWRDEASKAKEITKSDYQPNGCTALYDAVGTTITRLQKEPWKDASYLIIIMSDGEENSSKEWDTKRLAEEIQKLQKTNLWTFSYIGANTDLSKIQKDLHIPAGNTQAYASNPIGTQQVYASMSNATSGFMHQRQAGQTSSQAFNQPSQPSFKPTSPDPITGFGKLKGRKVEVTSSGSVKH